MKIKTKIKKVLQENCGEGFVFIEILNNEIEIMDFDSLVLESFSGHILL